MQIGRSRVDALRALGLRTNVTELRSFCAIVVQATELGVPIANVLREQAERCGYGAGSGPRSWPRRCR